MEQATLEKEVETGQERMGITTCGYDGKEINKATAYKSPYGDFYYCNQKCHDMFTED